MNQIYQILKKKIALIESKNPLREDLAENLYKIHINENTKKKSQNTYILKKAQLI